MSISDAVKVDIRRHLGYPLKGLPTAAPIGSTGSTAQGYRLNPEYQNLEWRLMTMTPAEETRVTGFAYGAIAYSGTPPNPGDTVTATFSGGGLGSPVPIVATAIAGDTQLTMLMKLVTLINQNATMLAQNFYAVSPWGTGVFAASNVPYPEIEIWAPAAFALTVTSTGAIGGVVTEAGGLPDPKIQVTSNPATYAYGFIPILNFLDGAVGGATRNLDVSKADTFVARHDEVPQREKLFGLYRKRLSKFLGVAILNGPRSRRAVI